MNLYRFTVLLNTKEELSVIVCADNDEQAFKIAEIEVEKHFLKLPMIDELVLIERKKVMNKGTGFVL